MTLKKLSIKEWSEQDRPREKLRNKGTNSLSDAELIAILLGSGTRELSAVELAQHILNTVNNQLHELGKLTVGDLMQIKGIGEAKAISIISALELGRRRKLSDIIEKQKVTNSKDVAAIFLALLSDLPHEEFWILLLNRSNRIIEKFKVSQGGTAGTVIDVKIILKRALERMASSIILCHNHPSGNLTPSESDIALTKKLKRAAQLMDISVLDHVIVGDEKYISFTDQNLI